MRDPTASQSPSLPKVWSAWKGREKQRPYAQCRDVSDRLAGAFGIHKFYLGRRFAGWWYLLFFWTLVPAFFALFDLVKLACMGSAKFDETYNMDNA